MCDLIGDYGLMAHEEAVLEAVVGWIKAGGGDEGGGELVGEGPGAHLRDLAKVALAGLILCSQAF